MEHHKQRMRWIRAQTEVIFAVVLERVLTTGPARHVVAYDASQRVIIDGSFDRLIAGSDAGWSLVGDTAH